MEIYERVRELRKKHLKLSQTDFGEKIGVSRSVINNIELNTLAKPEKKVSLMKLICKEFNVNEDWLLNGNGEMFNVTPADMMVRLKDEFNLDDFSAGVVYEYLKLDEEKRNTFRDFIYNILPYLDGAEVPQRKSYAEMSIDEKVDDSLRQLEDNEKAGEKSQALRRDA